MYQLNKKTKLIILLTILTISTLLLLTHSSLTLTKRHTKQTIHVNNRIQLTDMSACDGTLHRDLCVATLSSFPDLHRKSIPQIISDMVNHTMAEVKASKSICSRIRHKFVKKLGPLEKQALKDCLELLDYTIQQLREVMSDLSPRKSPVKHFHDLQTLLSAAMTNEATCLDGFAFSKSKIRPYIEGRLVNISHHVSNSLAMLKKIPGVNTTSYGTEVLPGYGVPSRGFPAWIKGNDRRLLQSSINQTTYNLMVAKDGTGNFTTIGEALEAAPNSSRTRFVIYIKAGAYYEYLEVVSRKTNLMFVGDGIGKTLIKGDRNVVDNFTTFGSSTVAVVGKGFIAKGITFENYAGPSKHQAVALRSGADLSAFYQCSFVAYQDTLYVHTLRQFYRECDIYGTIDFIFGNAAVVFQNCNMYARKPDPRQQNVFTAQGRQDPNQNTGISILNCKIAAGSELIPVQSSFKSYLGRPWKEYSRTVFLLSYIGDLIDPKGFLEWNGKKPLEERLVVRPTSETIVNYKFTEWIHSYRDLPLKINQWVNVTRWELRTKPFIRNLEFLWQEGHTAHATAEEAEKEALQMIDIYTKFAYEQAAIPVIAGRKSKLETFAGASRTYTIEAMMGDRKALQAGTSHNLGQNFSRAFGTQFTDANGINQFVWQTSWAISTRFLGAIFMTHGDDTGLLLPPRMAPIQVVIVPIWKKDDEKVGVLNAASSVKEVLLGAGIKVKLDDTDQKTPGWKYNYWEMKGVPLRIEIGPRDVASGNLVISRRDVPGKQGKVFGISMESSVLVPYVKDKLDEIQLSLLEMATFFRNSNIVDVNSYDELKAAISEGKWARGPWSASDKDELRVKEETGATIRCFPFEQPENRSKTCFMTGNPAEEVAIFAKSY